MMVCYQFEKLPPRYCRVHPCSRIINKYIIMVVGHLLQENQIWAQIQFKPLKNIFSYSWPIGSLYLDSANFRLRDLGTELQRSSSKISREGSVKKLLATQCNVNWAVIYPKSSYKIMDPVSAALPQNFIGIFVATLPWQDLINIRLQHFFHVSSPISLQCCSNLFWKFFLQSIAVLLYTCFQHSTKSATNSQNSLKTFTVLRLKQKYKLKEKLFKDFQLSWAKVIILYDEELWYLML